MGGVGWRQADSVGRHWQWAWRSAASRHGRGRRRLSRWGWRVRRLGRSKTHARSAASAMAGGGGNSHSRGGKASVWLMSSVADVGATSVRPTAFQMEGGRGGRGPIAWRWQGWRGRRRSEAWAACLRRQQGSGRLGDGRREGVAAAGCGNVLGVTGAGGYDYRRRVGRHVRWWCLRR